MVSSPNFFFLNYESMTTHLQESWKIQNKVKCYSVAESCWTLCDLTDCSMPGFPVLHGFLEFAHTHVHWVGDAVSHFSFLQSFPASGFFQWIGSLHQVAKVLELQLQHQSFQWLFRTDLGLIGLISLQSKGLSRVFCNTTVRKHQFFGAQPSLWSNSHTNKRLLEKPQLWLYRPLLAK